MDFAEASEQKEHAIIRAAGPVTRAMPPPKASGQPYWVVLTVSSRGVQYESRLTAGRFSSQPCFCEMQPLPPKSAYADPEKTNEKSWSANVHDAMLHGLSLATNSYHCKARSAPVLQHAFTVCCTRRQTEIIGVASADLAPVAPAIARCVVDPVPGFMLPCTAPLRDRTGVLPLGSGRSRT